MNRREIIKSMTATGAIAVLPQLLSAAGSGQLPFHFIGLGGAGCNALEAVYAKHKKGYFTCITDVERPYLPAAIQFISFPSSLAPGTAAQEYLLNDSFALLPTNAMQALLSQPHHYVLLTGLGGYTGTRLLQAFIQVLNKKDKPFTAIASLPFTWETHRRKAVEQLLPNLQALPRFHSFDLAQLSNEGENKKMNMRLFMQMADEKLYDIFLQQHPA